MGVTSFHSCWHEAIVCCPRFVQNEKLDVKREGFSPNTMLMHATFEVQLSLTWHLPQALDIHRVCQRTQNIALEPFGVLEFPGCVVCPVCRDSSYRAGCEARLPGVDSWLCFQPGSCVSPLANRTLWSSAHYGELKKWPRKTQSGLVLTEPTFTEK